MVMLCAIAKGMLCAITYGASFAEPQYNTHTHTHTHTHSKSSTEKYLLSNTKTYQW